MPSYSGKSFLEALNDPNRMSHTPGGAKGAVSSNAAKISSSRIVGDLQFTFGALGSGTTTVPAASSRRQSHSKKKGNSDGSSTDQADSKQGGHSHGFLPEPFNPDGEVDDLLHLRWHGQLDDEPLQCWPSLDEWVGHAANAPLADRICDNTVDGHARDQSAAYFNFFGIGEGPQRMWHNASDNTDVNPFKLWHTGSCDLQPPQCLKRGRQMEAGNVNPFQSWFIVSFDLQLPQCLERSRQTEADNSGFNPFRAWFSAASDLHKEPQRIAKRSRSDADAATGSEEGQGRPHKLRKDQTKKRRLRIKRRSP